MKRRSGIAQAAQHRHAGPMKHRLQVRGGARNESAQLLIEASCAASPTGKHVFSSDQEYAQKHHLAKGPICCEHCGEEP